MSNSTSIIGQALEGYTRKINPQYAAQQDAEEQKRLMNGIMQELGPAAAQHPYNLGEKLVATGNPGLVERGLNMLQEYHSGKTALIKEFEYFNTLTDPEEQYRWLSKNGLGIETIGGVQYILGPDGTKRLGVVTQDKSNGKIKVVVTGEVGYQDIFHGKIGDQPYNQNVNPNPNAPRSAYVSDAGNGQPQGDPASSYTTRGGSWRGPAGTAPPSVQALGAPQGQGGTTLQGTPANVPTASAQGVPQGAPQGAPAPVPPQMGQSPQAPPAPDTVGQAPTSGNVSPGGLSFPINPNDANKLLAGQVSAKEKAKYEEKRLNNLMEDMPTDLKKLVNTYNNTKYVQDNIAKAAKLIEEIGPGVTGSALYSYKHGQAAKAGTPAASVHGAIESINAALGFDRMGQLRDLSESGSLGTGELSIPEFVALQSNIRQLNQSESWPQLYENLRAIEDSYIKYIKAAELYNAEKYRDHPEQLEKWKKYKEALALPNDFSTRLKSKEEIDQLVKDKKNEVAQFREEHPANWSTKILDWFGRDLPGYENWGVHNIERREAELGGAVSGAIDRTLKGADAALQTLDEGMKGSTERIDKEISGKMEDLWNRVQTGSLKSHLSDRVIDKYRITSKELKREIKRKPLDELLELLNRAPNVRPLTYGENPRAVAKDEYLQRQNANQ